MIENTTLSIPIFVSIGDISHIRGSPSDEELEIIENKDLQGLELEEAPFQEEQLDLDIIDGRELRRGDQGGGGGSGGGGGGGSGSGGKRKNKKHHHKKRGGGNKKRNKRCGSRKVRYLLVTTCTNLPHILHYKPISPLLFCITSTIAIKRRVVVDVVGSLGQGQGESIYFLL